MILYRHLLTTRLRKPTSYRKFRFILLKQITLEVSYRKQNYTLLLHYKSNQY